MFKLYEKYYLNNISFCQLPSWRYSYVITIQLNHGWKDMFMCHHIVIKCQSYQEDFFSLNVLKMSTEGRWCSMLITFNSCVNSAGWHLLINQNPQTSTISKSLTPYIPLYLAPKLNFKHDVPNFYEDRCLKWTFLPSNSAWPTPTIIMDIGSLAACKGKEIKSDRKNSKKKIRQ